MKLTLNANNSLAVAQQLERIGTKDVPFALRKALTNTAFGIRDAIKGDMRRAFDRPTPFTLNSTLIRHPAGKKLFASDGTVVEVFVKDDAEKGTPPSDYLEPEVFGGVRKIKRSEFRLRQQGILGPSSFVVPASGAKLDRYGNIPRGTMTKLLSSLGVLGDVGGNATRLHRTRKGYTPIQYFVVNKPGTALAEGIWEKIGNRLRPVVLFVKEPHYRERFDFFGVAERIGRDLLPAETKKVVQWILDHPRR